MGRIREMIKNWLEIVPVGTGIGSILSDSDFGREVARNRVWYRGNVAELSQFYGGNDDLVGNRSFWAASGANAGIRKMHSGLPALIVDTVADIAANDMLGVRMGDEAAQAIWDEIADDNGFERLLGRAVREAVALGDGAFKISFDLEVSQLPIIEFYGADRVRMVYKRGRLTEVVFLQPLEHEGRRYVLEEGYRDDGIDYRLIDWRGAPADLGIVRGRYAPITHSVGMNMAVPLIFDENPRAPGRGKSIFDGKIGAFDALDEVLSQWVDALRDGRAQKYIPIGLLPRDPNSGMVRGLSQFQSRFIQTELDMAEGADNSIKVVQPSIDTQAMVESANHFMMQALQGILAPATLGIDMQRRDNALAQREKEKATLYTRGKIIGVLRDVVAQLARAAVAAYGTYYDKEVGKCEVKVEFGEYAAPNFDAQVETIGKGRQMGVISVENAVEQLYGSTWSQEQKRVEVERIMNYELRVTNYKLEEEKR